MKVAIIKQLRKYLHDDALGLEVEKESGAEMEAPERPPVPGVPDGANPFDGVDEPKPTKKTSHRHSVEAAITRGENGHKLRSIRRPAQCRFGQSRSGEKVRSRLVARRLPSRRPRSTFPLVLRVESRSRLTSAARRAAGRPGSPWSRSSAD